MFWGMCSHYTDSPHASCFTVSCSSFDLIHIVMTWQSALAAGCIIGNCLLGVDLCVITVRSLSFCDSKVMWVNVQVRSDVLGSFTA